MASVYDLKPRFQSLLRPLCGRLAGFGVTANQITLAAIVLSCLYAVIAFVLPSKLALLLLPTILFVRMALNAIDGMLAREFHMKSKLGAVLNELGDVVSDLALYGTFAFLMPDLWTGALVILVVILGILTEFSGVVAVQIGASRRYDGPFGKSDRALGFGLVAVLLALDVLATAWLGYVLLFFAALAGLTIVNRLRTALAEVAAIKKTDGHG